MAKQQKATMAAASVAGAAVAEATDESVGLDRADSMIRHEEIAQLAYSYWQARGCPEGSPEEDWLRAKDELEKQAAAAAV